AAPFRAAELAGADFPGVSAPSERTEVQAFRRAQWVEADSGGLRALLEPVAGRLTSAMAQAQGETLPFAVGEGAGPPNDMVEMLLQRMVPLLLGTQVGTVLGYLGQRVLGQYDLAVPRPAGSLCFVIPNIAAFER